jgi:hypothetical protein
LDRLSRVILGRHQAEGGLWSIMPTVDWETILTAVAGGLAALSRINAPWAARGRRNEIKHDVELLNVLPDGDAKMRLEKDINKRIIKMIEEREFRKTDPYALFWMVVFAALTVWTLIKGLEGPNWWFVGTAFMGALTVSAFNSTFFPKRKNDQGVKDAS